jgi:hypothetical protein
MRRLRNRGIRSIHTHTGNPGAVPVMFSEGVLNGFWRAGALDNVPT